ncbi:AAA family ATPase [Nocardia sp. NPDC005745]|uniref:AAA family ATPase n=1 Tax=Nocardia sp. NPDC005745 TaxID=3157061 RepID=UPI0033FEED9C
MVADAVRKHDAANPDRRLNAGQIGVIEGFATSGLQVQTANAPAGSGKTTAMRVLTDAWHHSGGKILGLAPTASAAAVLGQSIGARTETVDKLLHDLNQHLSYATDPMLDRGTPRLLPEWALRIDRDTLVIVDEHVKLGNRKPLRLLEFLTERGATVRCIGDDHQLPAIEADGAEADASVATSDQTMILTQVVRFASMGEAAASLQLRESDTAALGWYLDNARVHAGHQGATHDEAYTTWVTDHLAGRDTLILAATHEVVTALNARARADRITRNGGDIGAECVLADGLAASVGDTIRTRRNNPRLRLGDHDWVRNGYSWTITDVYNDGSITAHATALAMTKQAKVCAFPPTTCAPMCAPATRRRTIDSAQGITTDTCHVALTGAETRQQFCVAMTRGKHGTYVYDPTALDGNEASFWSEPAVFPRTAVEVLVRVLGRDGARKSAHTQLRDALDPYARIGRALDVYLDALGVAAEHALGPDGVHRIDTAAETVRPHLTDSPAYPVLRQHLAVIAMTGRDPVTALESAAAARELDTADDPAAVLDWRLDPTGMHTSNPGPLPWARGLPATLHTDPVAEHLQARQRVVTDLAHQIRDDTRGVDFGGDEARTELSITPRYRRGQRRQLQTRIDALLTERINRDRHHTTAHDSARSAHRTAILLAGAEHEWDQILANHPKPLSGPR